MKIILLVMSLLSGSIFPNLVNAKTQENAITIEVNKFLGYLISRNEAKLAEFEDGNPIFSSNGKLNNDIYNFLYKPNSPSKSTIEITKLDRLKIKIVKQSDNVITVLFYPKKYHWSINRDPAFLERQWMKKYFACEFKVLGDKLKLFHNFCFAETDGPFPATY